ncbi:uncharacterized protein Triagg1_9120 [Trichoderma aggressivum f. europaeum]|uniref:Ketoreductase domain-containing protein n=1 Tax=Trichoderma aggressivum f. europaeum TaxID=173218 RepID=A0AAE1LWN7_9HYPO|nr:hypothetical protein Triagg1_9120 [Trichoderma aggressivum f. europaeum]
MDKAGLHIGPLFQRLSDARTGTVQALASGNSADLELDDDDDYHLHSTYTDQSQEATLPFGPRPRTLGCTGEVVSRKQQIVVSTKNPGHRLEIVQPYPRRKHVSMRGPQLEIVIENLARAAPFDQVSSLSRRSAKDFEVWEGLYGSPVEVIGQHMRQIANNIADICSGKTDTLEVLKTDDILDKMRDFGDERSTEYLRLDISRDPAEQGLSQTLANVHKSLDAGGRFLLQELQSVNNWPNHVADIVPGWWWYGAAEDPRDQPCASLVRWKLEDIGEAHDCTVQRLLGGLDEAALFWIAHSGQASRQNPDYAQLVGLAKTIRTEALSNFAVCEADDFINGAVHAPRAYSFVPQDELKIEARVEDQLVLEASKPSRLASLNWVRREPRHLREEVEIELHAMVLNFMAPKPGDHVVVLKAGIFTTQDAVSEKLCLQIPDNHTFDGAATMVTVFSSAVESFFNVVRLEKGQVSKRLASRFIVSSAGVRDVHQRAYLGNLGKIVNSLRHLDGCLEMDTQATVAIREPELEHSASYVLARGLGGLGRSIARYQVENNARWPVPLPRSAGDSLEDADFVHELESLGYAAEFVKVSVVNKEDVARAMQLVPNLKPFSEVKGTWNIHEATCQSGIKLDFFILLSAIRHTFLDIFVQYRNGLGLRELCIDLEAVQDADNVANDDALLNRMNLANTNGDFERELLKAVERGILSLPAT